MPYVGSSVDESTKEKWENHLEESSYGSMSELVRGAVRKEIQSDDGSGGTSDGQTIEVDRLQEQQQETIQRIEGLQETIEEAQEERETTEYPEEIVEVAHDIAGDLETISTDGYKHLTTDALSELANLSQEHFGDKTQVDKISAALDYLEENVSWIRKRPVLPSEYYRVED
jgi:Arc/MetJ-type ribon-helix-helix transcriptional regulator